MTINIPRDVEQIIYRQLSSGRFAGTEDVLRAALASLEALGISDARDESAVTSATRCEIQHSKITLARLPEFFTSSDDSFVPADIPMPRGRFVQPVKGGKRLPEFHGIE
jgi:Arc/MetJ-type ribon-helix-helix transcriptional regulator